MFFGIFFGMFFGMFCGGDDTRNPRFKHAPNLGLRHKR